MSDIKAVLFDIDGTLLNSEELIYSSFEQTLLSYGIKHERPVIRQALGRTLEDGYKILVPDAEPDHLLHMMEKHKLWSINNLHLITPFADMDEVVKELHARDIKVAAVTNRQKWGGASIFSNLPLEWAFHAVVTADDVKHPKPHPEPVLKALTHLEVATHHAVLVGDSDADMQAGQAAGVRTVGAAYGTFGKDIHLHTPHHIIHSLSDLLQLI